MPDPLLRTKFFVPPVRPTLVRRPRLIQQLNQGLQPGHKLTLISAPAGFGKTTLASEWVANLRQGGVKEGQIDYRIAWLSLDDNDNDLTRFLTYLVTTLNQVVGAETIGKGALGILQSPQPPTELVLTSLINDIADIADSFILILDDYYLIDSSPIDEALSFFLEHLPQHMHLVITTRADPNLPLARLRARDQLTELRATDLRFTSTEADEFLNQVMGFDLSTEEIAALGTRTEGWIAGLQLAALALKRAISMKGYGEVTNLIKSFTGSHRLVLDYLIEDVLNYQTQQVQEFLLQTAILNRLAGSLCDALTGRDNGQTTLEMLEQANLFIVPLDDERRWYRYHHLFADLLRQRLTQSQPELLLTLHRKASVWYEHKGFFEEAINHALRGEYFTRAAYLIESQYGDNYERVSQTVLRRWLAEMPEEFVSSEPHLCLFRAWTLFTTGQLDAADQSLQATEKMLDPGSNQEPDVSSDEGQLSDMDRMKLLGRAAAIRSFIVSFGGDTPGTIRYARQALEYLPEEELQWRSTVLVALGDAYANDGRMADAYNARSAALAAGKASGDPYLLMIVNLRLAEILRQQGKLQQVEQVCVRQLRSAEENGISEWTIVGWLFGIWGEVLAELNNLDGAKDRATKGVELATRGGDLLYEIMSKLCLVRALFSCRDLNGAEEVIQSMENTSLDYDMPLWALVQLSAWRARIWLALGRIEVASRWAEEYEPDVDEEPSFLNEMELMAYARILITQRRLDEATGLLQRLLHAAEAGGRTSRMIEVMILQALTLQAKGETDRALVTLEGAFALAEPEGFVRTFVDEGPPMAHLLNDALDRGISPVFVHHLLAAYPKDEPVQVDTTESLSDQSDLVEELSERELEVLHLIAKGLTNREIADRLYLSLNTVKVHARNIYGKLSVGNRTQAVARARDLGVLPRS